jgi:hypothetical protein
MKRKSNEAWNAAQHWEKQQQQQGRSRAAVKTRARPPSETISSPRPPTEPPPQRSAWNEDGEENQVEVDAENANSGESWGEEYADEGGEWGEWGGEGEREVEEGQCEADEEEGAYESGETDAEAAVPVAAQAAQAIEGKKGKGKGKPKCPPLRGSIATRIAEMDHRAQLAARLAQEQEHREQELEKRAKEAGLKKVPMDKALLAHFSFEAARLRERRIDSEAKDGYHSDGDEHEWTNYILTKHAHKLYQIAATNKIHQQAHDQRLLRLEHLLRQQFGEDSLGPIPQANVGKGPGFFIPITSRPSTSSSSSATASSLDAATAGSKGHGLTMTRHSPIGTTRKGKGP